MQHVVLFARGGRFLKDLWNGEPMAWVILGGVVLIMGGWHLFKVLMANNHQSMPSAQDERDVFPRSRSEEDQA